MLKTGISILLFIIFAMHLHDVSADTIILESGRQIKCSKVKEENGMIKCLIDGFEIGYLKSDVKTFIRDKQSGKKTIAKGFTFDIWYSGMDIDSVMNIAAINDVPLHRHGLISENTHFNPEMCRDYIHTADEFYYNDHLMGKPAKVTLFFTPQSKILEKIQVSLHSSDIDQESSYPKEIEAMLTTKYGTPSRLVGPHAEGVFRDSASWKLKGNCTVLMETGSGQVDIIYSDLKLNTIGSKERNAIKAIQSEQYRKKDASKF
jgi:hypothetical protein